MATTTHILDELHHEVRGSGPPVVFIPGASGDSGNFARVGGQLADEFTTVTYDRRGCSRSVPLAEGERMTIAGQAEDVAALVEGLGLVPAVAFGTSAGGDILLELIARCPDVLRGAIVHEPALPALARKPDPEADPFAAIVELAASDPRRAMEAFLRTVTSDATFEGLDPELRERVVGNGAHFFADEFAAIGAFTPDVERIRAAGVPLRMLVSREGGAEVVRVTARLAEQLGAEPDSVSGHHAPYTQHPEVFAEELRPLLRELS